jgi:hypothetical protein
MRIGLPEAGIIQAQADRAQLSGREALQVRSMPGESALTGKVPAAVPALEARAG